jgi:hypothetical protein
MCIRRLLPAVCLTACSVGLAIWFLSVYVPVPPVKNAPGIAARFDGAQAMLFLDSLAHQFKGRRVGSPQGFASADYVAEQFRFHLFPAAKLAIFTALYTAALLACIWGIFGRRQPQPDTNLA